MSMELLQPERLIGNMEKIVGRSYASATGDIFEDIFWSRISTIQNTSSIFQNDRFEFEKYKNFKSLSMLGLVSGESGLLRISEEQKAMVAGAMTALARDHPCLDRAIQLSTPRNAFINAPSLVAMSGSSFSAIGFSFVNLNELKKSDVVKLMIHESVHNAINIEDICEGIFTEKHIVEDKRYHFLSSIRKTARRFDYAFHALMVDIALYQFDMIAASRPERERERNIALCLDAARRTRDRSVADGKPLLTANGDNLLETVAASWQTALP